MVATSFIFSSTLFWLIFAWCNPSMARNFVALVKIFNLKLMSSLLPVGVAEDVLKDWAWLAEMGERGKNGLPFAAVTHCLCVAE